MVITAMIEQRLNIGFVGEAVNFDVIDDHR